MSSSRQNINRKLDGSINNNKEEIKIENENNIKFIRRTIENNTHEVFEDIKLKSITSWRKSKTKFLKNLIYNILTFGILHIISLFKPNLYLKLYCYPWPAKECDFFLVENIYGELTLCTKIHKKAKNNNNINFSADLSKDNIVSPSIINNSNKFENYLIKNLTYSFKYKSVTYEYREDTNEIVPVYMNISKMTNRGIFNYFSEGLSSEKMVNKFLERYGKNEYNIYLGIIYFYFLRIELPYLIVVSLIGLIELCLKDYFSIISKYVIIALILNLEYQITKRVVYNSYTKEYTLDGEKYKLKVKRKHKLIKDSNFYYEIKNCDLLPGDIIFLKENDLVPCDCLILEGECIVNESNSTGSLDIFKKTSLENNNEQFNYEMNKINILYHGMKIIKTFSKSNNGYISVLCINTGPNTYKANQYSNVLYFLERKKEYREMYELFGEKRKNMVICIIAIFFISILLALIYYKILDLEPLDFKDSDTQKYLFTITVRIFCKSFMPGFFLTNSIILILGVYHLKKENILCFEKSKLLSSSTIDTIFFSKTGTLCENNFEINGYHPIYINPHKSNNISYRTYKFSQYKEMNSQLLQYYKNYLYRVQNNSSNYEFNLRHGLKFEHNRLTLDKINKESYQYTTLFLECLLTCNNIEKFNNEVFGNSIETEIFKNMRWDMKAYNNNNITKNIESNQDISKNKSVNKKEFKGSKIGYLDRSKNDIYPNNYYKITESVKNENGFHPQPIKTRLNSKYYLEQSKKLNNSICSEATLIKNFIRNDISHSHINSYKLRIYRRFIKNGTLNSSAIVYNFITKELRFMTKGNPEDILDKCDPGTIPDNIDNIISIYRRNGFIIIICASKIINIDDYNDSNSCEEYMNDLTFCGFVTLKNKLKKEVLNAIKDLRQFSCNLIITTGDNVFNSLSVGFDSHIIENKNIFSFDKEDKKSGIIIEKIYGIKRLNQEEDKNSDSSLDMNSKQTTKISNRLLTSSFTKPKESVMLKYMDPNTIHSSKAKAGNVIMNELSLNQESNKNSNENKNLTPNKTLRRKSIRKYLKTAKYISNYDENSKYQKHSRLYTEISDIKNNQIKKDAKENSRISNISPLSYKDRSPYQLPKKNKSINENKENQDSTTNTNKKFKISNDTRSKNV
jgi:cation-transporting ATPase 13A3/4/5